MRQEALDAMLSFLSETERLKSVLRTAWTADGRRESTAEHSWHLALWAMVFLEEFPALDGRRVLELCLLHDLGELYGGDVSAALRPDANAKQQQERRDVLRAVSLLPAKNSERFAALWEEYEAGETPEAQLVRALDKAETILQHSQGKNPPDFDYGFNLGYGAALFEKDRTLRQLRALLDERTRARIDGADETEEPPVGAHGHPLENEPDASKG